MNAFEKEILFREFVALAVGTNAGDWSADGENGTMDPAKMARAIPPARWGKAFKLAEDVSDTLPHLPPPVPGADPDGGVWLTWEKSKFRLALKLLRGKFAWTMRTDGGESSHESESPYDLVQALDATFPRIAVP